MPRLNRKLDRNSDLPQTCLEQHKQCISLNEYGMDKERSNMVQLQISLYETV